MKRRNKKGVLNNQNTFFVGLLGLEPRKTGPESVVLPLHHSPITLYPLRENAANEVGLLGLEPRKTGPESVVLPLHHSPKSENDCHLFVLTVQRYNFFGTYKAFRHFFLSKNIFFFFLLHLSSKNFRIYRKPSIFVLCYNRTLFSILK